MPLFLEKSGAKNLRQTKNLLKMPVRSLKELNSSRSINYIYKVLKRDSNSNSFPFRYNGTDVNSSSFSRTEIFRMPRKEQFFPAFLRPGDSNIFKITA